MPTSVPTNGGDAQAVTPGDIVSIRDSKRQGLIPALGSLDRWSASPLAASGWLRAVRSQVRTFQARYKARAYRSRAVREPRAVLREFGLDLPDGVRVVVHDSTAELRYMVVPERPAGTEGWSEERLAGIVTRDCMIGVAVPRAG